MGRIQIKEERAKEGETIEKAKYSIKSKEYKMCIRGDKKINWNSFSSTDKISCKIITKIVHMNSKI